MTTFAEEILSILPQKKSAHIIALSGELGAGKTTFTKALARKLGIVEHVTSPTFVVMKVYEVSEHSWIRKLVHIDAYRIEDIDEMRVLNLNDICTEEGTVVCIEWPENIAALIPEDALQIRIDVEGSEGRVVTTNI